MERLEDRTLLSVDLTKIPIWQAEGPGPILNGQSLTPVQSNEVVGAVQAIAVNPSDRNNVFIGTANGGIWETSNATDPEPAWQPLTDQYPSLSVGSIAFSPFNNVLYAGTANVSNTNILGTTNGLLKSVDGGQHWSILGSDLFQALNIVSVVPTSLDSGNIVLLATSNGFFTGPPGSSSGGVYRSDDGGQTWNRWSGDHGLPEAGVSDLVEDPGNASRFYAGIPGIGIYRSDDGGVSWHPITNDLTTQITDLATSLRIRLALSQAFPAAVYAGVIDKNGQLEGLFQSTPTDNPAEISWTSLSAAPPIQTNPGKQGMANFSIAVDPNDSNIVYVGGDRRDSPPYVGDIYKVSEANGSWTWTPITAVGQPATAPHADSRTMLIDSGGDLLDGDDGGIYRLQSPAAPGAWSSMNGSLQNTEFYSVAYDALNHEIIGGSQDTGVSQENHTQAIPPVWVAPFLGNAYDPGQPDDGQQVYAAGDGGNVAASVDNSDPSRWLHYFMGNNFSQFYRTAYDGSDVQQNIGNYAGIDFTNPLNAGLSFRRNYSAATVLLASPNYPDIWLSGLNAVDSVLAHSGDFETVPYVLNNISPSRMLIGRTDLYESRDQGDTITDITPLGMNRVTALAYGGYIGGVANADVAYVGAVNQLWLRTTPGGSFQLLKGWSDIGGGFGWLNGPRKILMDPGDWHTVFVIDDNAILEGTGVGTPDEKWKMLDGPGVLIGSTQLAGKTIPHFFTGELVTINGTTVLLVGTNSGVYRLIDPEHNTVWTKYGMGLPNITVTDLHYEAGDDVLIAGTRGRGAWEVLNASTTLAAPSIVPIQFDTFFDTIRLVRDNYNPLMLDIIDTGANVTDQLPMSAVQEIDVTALGGSDNLIVDDSNGMVQVDQFTYTGADQGTQLEIDGNPGDVFTNLPTPNLPNTGYVVVQGKDMGDIGEAIFYSHVPVVDTTVANPLGSPQTVLDTVRNGLQTLFGWSGQLASPSVLGRNIPVVGRALGDLLNGVSPESGGAPASDVDAGAASSLPAPTQPGSPFLQRVFETGPGGFPIANIGTSIATFDQLQQQLQALGNNTAVVSYTTDTSGGVRFDFQMQTTLSGTAPVDLPIQSAGLDLKGLADISADVRIHLIFGVDANGFFIDAADNPDPMVVVSNLRVTGNVSGDATFGNLDISLTDATLSVDPQLQLALSLNPPGQDPLNQANDGYLRLVELNAEPATLVTSHLSMDTLPGSANVTFTGTFGISALNPPLPINVNAPQLIFTWFDPTVPETPQVAAGNVDGQALLAYLIAPVTGGQPSSTNNFGAIPTFNASSAQQTLFGPDATTQQVPTGGQTGTISTLLQFAASGTGQQTNIQFNLEPANDSASGDKAALALYDSLGNLIQLAADEPIPGHPGIEGLSATLATGHVYFLGVFFNAASASDVFNLTTQLGAQSTQQPIGLDLTSGDSGQIADTFTTPATVNYYPLDLLGAGNSATVTITPTGLETDPYAAVFGRTSATEPWVMVTNGANTQAFVLSLTPPANKSLTDAEYLLVVAPEGFDTAARSYSIDLQASLPLLAPATVEPTAATTLLPAPIDASTAEAVEHPLDPFPPNQVLLAGGQLLYQFRAPADGTAVLTLQSGAFEPELAVYDLTGTQLLGVATSTIVTGTARLSLPVQSGTVYTVRVSDVANQNGGIFDLQIRTPYAPTPLVLAPVPLAGAPTYGSVVQIQISAGPNTGGEYFQLTPAVGTQILVFEVQPGTGANPIVPQLTLIGPNAFQKQFFAPASEPLYAIVDISHQAGPFVLYIGSTTGSDPATLKVGQVQIPQLLPDSDTDLQGTSADLGGNVTGSPQAGSFGTLAGVKYTQLPAGGVKFQLSVQGTGTAEPLLVHYKFNGVSFQLVDFMPPGPGATGVAQINDEIIPDNEVDAVAAISLDVDNGTGNTFQIAAQPESALPIPGIGVAMVPTSPPDLKDGQPTPAQAPPISPDDIPLEYPLVVYLTSPPISLPPPYQSKLAIEGATFQHDYEQHIWKTIVPFDLSEFFTGDVPVVTFIPAGGSSALLQVRLRVYFSDDPNHAILDVTSPGPGQSFQYLLNDQSTSLRYTDFAGKTLIFQVTPSAGQPLGSDGTGGYSLYMIADTGDPHPFEVTEPSFYFSGGTGVGYFPPGTTVTDVVQNQFGHGEATGDITDPAPYTSGDPGSINVFRFWDINPGPVAVKSIDDLPDHLNTDLKIYKALYDANGNLYLQEIPGVPPSFDWLPADRSRIDAESYVNDYRLLDYTPSDLNGRPKGFAFGGEYYVVVKGQEGTTGSYRLVVDTPGMPLLGNTTNGSPGPSEQGQVAYISPTTGGTVALNAYLGDVPGLIGYYPIQVPAYHTGPLSVTSLDPSQSSSSGRWDMAVFDAQGNQLDGTVSDRSIDIGYGPVLYTYGSFTVPDGAQTVYLRVRSKESAAPFPGAQLYVTMSLGSVQVPPELANPIGDEVTLGTNPQGDGSHTASTADSTNYWFQAAAGPLTVQIVPDVSQATPLVWGVYVNGNLLAWNVTGSDPATMTETFLLPDLRQPGSNPDFAYDQAPYDDVQLYVSAGNYMVSVHTASFVVERDLATGEPVDQSGDLFAAHLDSAPVLPMRNADLAIDPLGGQSDIETVTGLEWLRLGVPQDFAGQIQVNLTYSGLVASTFQYDLYGITNDASGNFVGQLLATGETSAIGLPGLYIGSFALPSGLAGGTSYYLRVEVTDDPTDLFGSLDVAASVDVSGKQRDYTPSSPTGQTPGPGLPSLPLQTVEPLPDGTIHAHLTTSTGTDVYTYSVGFWAGSGGMADLSFKLVQVDIEGFMGSFSADPYIALYHLTSSPGEGAFDLQLIDFVNDANSSYDSSTDAFNYHLSAWLDPGLYLIEVVADHIRTTNSVAEVSVDGSIPVAPVQQIVVDPNNGTSEVNLAKATTEFGPSNDPIPDLTLAGEYRTVFYRVITPGASQDGLTVFARDPYQTVNPSETEGGYADMSIFWGPFFFNGQVTPWVDATDYSSAKRLEAAANNIDGSTGGMLCQTCYQIGSSSLVGGSASPGGEYLIGLYRHDLEGTVDLAADFTVPQSGTPDWVVEPIQLAPDRGNTLITVKVRNLGYALAPSTESAAVFMDASKVSGMNLIPSKMLDAPIAALDFHDHVFSWLQGPSTPDDTVSYVANSTDPLGVITGATTVEMSHKIDEKDYTNDVQTVALNTVDPFRPIVSFAFSDPAMNGTGNVNASPVWGRYVAGVAGVTTNITIHATDVLNGVQGAGLWDVDMEIPSDLGFQSGPVGASGLSADQTLTGADFGLLQPTTPGNPNVLAARAKDIYGLQSDPTLSTKTINVVAFPTWLTLGNPGDPNNSGDGSSGTGITFDPVTHRYQLTYHNAIVDEEGTLDDILKAILNGVDIPFIGEKKNEFLIEVTASGTAGLDPNEPISMPATGHVLIQVVGVTIFDQTYGQGDVSDHLSFDANVLVSSTTLQAQTVMLSFGLHDLSLAHFETPEIPLVALGIPDVAAIQASLQFGLDVTLNADLTIGIDVSTGQLGLMAPTFIKPKITASATVSGEVTVVGIDLAKLSGSVTFGLQVAYGLNTPAGQLIPFGQFADNSALDLTGTLGGHLEADVFLIGSVWSYDVTAFSLTYDVFGGQVSGDPSGTITLTEPSGSTAVHATDIEAAPNLVIDPSSGNALYLQTINVAPSGTPPQGNLAFDERTGGNWPTTLTTLSESSYVSGPVLGLTNDQTGTTAAVAVYSAIDNDPSTLTENQALTMQDLRFRYFDGTNWGSEQTLVADGLYNSDPVLSFNSSGQGVVAWVNNTDTNPINGSGQFDRSSNEIEASIWDPQNHVWSLPQPLTNNSVSDSQPAVFADPSGNFYLVWLEDTASGNQVMCSIYSGGTWSTPAPLPINGLPANGSISQLAIGSEQAGRIDVLMAYDVPMSDGTALNGLYNRPSTTAGFANPAYVELVASRADFSHLRALQTPDGGLLAYWQQSDGITNDIFASKIGPVTSTWSAPMRLTNDSNPADYGGLPPGSDLPVAPSVAVDTTGNYQVVYQMQSVADNNNPGMGTLDLTTGIPATDGVGTSSDQQAPELYFSKPMVFPDRDVASSGVSTVENGAGPGTQVAAEAQIVNRGLTADNVELDFFDGMPDSGTAVGSETVTLGPGQTFDISNPFTVLPGTQTYSIEAIALGGTEVTGAIPHVTSATLVGMGDIGVTRTYLSDPKPVTGEQVNVSADVANLGNVPFGSFDVSLYLGDPAIQPNPQPIATTTISGLDAFGKVTITLPWTVPAGGGSFELSVLADSGDVLQEVTRANNEGHVTVSVLPDAAVIGPVQADLLDYSGVNNVRVTATIGNIGQADLANVPVELEWSWNGEQFQPVGQTTIANLAAGSSLAVSLTSGGFAGTNIYRVVVDPNMTLPDASWSNNAAQTALEIEGLPDLRLNTFSLVSPDTTQVPTVQAMIQNAGIAAADSVPVEIFLVPANTGNDQATIEAIGQVVGETTLSALDPLANTPLTMQLTVDFAAITGQELAMIVDPDNSIMLKDHVHTVATIQVGTLDTCVNFNLDQNGVLTIMKNCNEVTNDTITVGMTAAGGVAATLDSDSVQFTPGVVTAIVIDGGNGNDTITINNPGPLNITVNTGTGHNQVNVPAVSGTPDGTFVNIDGNGGTDTVTVGSLAPNLGGTLANIYASVFVRNSAGGHTDLIVDDSGDASPQTAGFSFAGSDLNIINNTGSHANIWPAADGSVSTTFDGGPGGGSVNFYGTVAMDNSLNLQGPETVTVYATDAPLTVNGGRGSDTVNIGPQLIIHGGGLSEINGPITITNPGGQTALTLDDSNVGTPKTAQMSATTVTGLAPATIDYTNANLSSLTINGGYGGNTFYVTNTPAGASTTINTGTGTDIVYVGATTGPLTVNLHHSGIGFDGVQVGAFTRDLDPIQGAVTLNPSPAGPYESTFAVFDDADTTGRTFTVTGTTISRPGAATITYGSSNEIELFLGSGGNVCDIQSTSMATAIVGGLGNDTFNVGDAANTLDHITGGYLAFQIAKPGSQLTLNDEGNHTAMEYTFTDLGGNLPGLIRTDNVSQYTEIFYTGPLQNLNLNSSTGGDTIYVQNTPAGTTTTINGSGTDSVHIGNTADGVGDIQGQVDITNNSAAGSYTTLSVDDSTYDQGYWVSRLTQSSLTTILRTDGAGDVQVAPINFDHAALSSLRILLGNSPGVSGNIAVVADTPTSSFPGGMRTAITSGIAAGPNDEIAIEATTGPLTVNLNNDGLHPASSAYLGAGIRSLENIRGAVTVNSSSGWTDLVLDDSANTNPHTYTITGNTVAFRNKLPVVTYHVTNEVELDAGLGVNTIRVNSTSTATVIRGGASGKDTIKIGGPGNSLAGITGGYLSIAVVNPGSRVLLDDQGNTDTEPQTYTFSTLTPGVAQMQSSLPGYEPIIYSGPLKTVTLNSSNGNDNFAIHDLPLGQTHLVIQGGSESNTLSGPDIDNSWQITAANGGSLDGVVKFSSVQSLKGGAGADRFRIITPAGGKSPLISGSIDGGGGVNTLDYSRFTGDVLVDLLLNIASQVTGGLFNVQNVVGSQGNDILVGDASANDLRGGTGRNLIIGGAGPDRIIGGGGDNILVAGTTAYDTNLSALETIMAEWLRTDLTFRQRIDFIQSGGDPSEPYQLNASTVSDDGVADTLTGGAGQNWFFWHKGQDKITNYKKGRDYQTLI
jgi:hypothetical protein